MNKYITAGLGHWAVGTRYYCFSRQNFCVIEINFHYGTLPPPLWIETGVIRAFLCSSFCLCSHYSLRILHMRNLQLGGSPCAHFKVRNAPRCKSFNSWKSSLGFIGLNVWPPGPAELMHDHESTMRSRVCIRDTNSATNIFAKFYCPVHWQQFTTPLCCTYA